MAAAQKTEGLMYKGHPLRRIGNMIYYGSMADPYIILMQVRESKKVQDLDVATKVSVELQMTAQNLKSRDRIVKKTEKDRLCVAGAGAQRQIRKGHILKTIDYER